ncbi:MAG: IS21-like element helper ATPase IstB [Methanosarcinaceae archaeon]
MKPQVLMVLKENLKQLRLSSMSREIETLERQAIAANHDFGEFLLTLTELELQIRGENSLKRRLKEATFPLLKTLEGFEYESAPGLNPMLIRELSGCDYTKKSRNIILMGKSGTGKTHLATALGVESCRHGIRTKFVTACGLANELIEAKDDKNLQRKLKKYERYGLLIIDELGYVPFSKDGANLLFQVLANRHERKSVIITTNLGFGDWTQVFGDPNLTAALLDRLTHKAHIINCSWDSFRLKDSLKRKK